VSRDSRGNIAQRIAATRILVSSDHLLLWDERVRNGTVQYQKSGEARTLEVAGQWGSREPFSDRHKTGYLLRTTHIVAKPSQASCSRQAATCLAALFGSKMTPPRSHNGGVPQRHGRTGGLRDVALPSLGATPKARAGTECTNSASTPKLSYRPPLGSTPTICRDHPSDRDPSSWREPSGPPHNWERPSDNRAGGPISHGIARATFRDGCAGAVSVT